MRNRNPVYRIGILMAGAALSALSAQAQDSDKRDVAELRQETVIVTSRAQQLYRVQETSSGKLPTEPLLSTQTITVINSQLIEDQGARDAQDLYRNISGVTVYSYAGVTARGFRQEENFFDGLRGDPYAGFSVPQLFNVDRVEFLKGPAGMLYGAGAPGGLFNYITKTPSQDFAANVSAVYGTEGRKGASFDVTGALPVDGAAGRLGVFYEDQNGPRWNTGSETDIYDAGLSFDLGLANLVLQATRYEQKLGGNCLRTILGISSRIAAGTTMSRQTSWTLPRMFCRQSCMLSRWRASLWMRVSAIWMAPKDRNITSRAACLTQTGMATWTCPFGNSVIRSAAMKASPWEPMRSGHVSSGLWTIACCLGRTGIAMILIFRVSPFAASKP